MSTVSKCCNTITHAAVYGVPQIFTGVSVIQLYNKIYTTESKVIGIATLLLHLANCGWQTFQISKSLKPKPQTGYENLNTIHEDPSRQIIESSLSIVASLVGIAFGSALIDLSFKS